MNNEEREKQDKEEVKICPCPYPELHKNNESHHCLVVLTDGTITENIYLTPSDCNENTAERVLLHESIHAILYHFLDEQKFRSLLPKLINGEINCNDELKKLISTKYDASSKLFSPSKNFFSSLVEVWNLTEWDFFVDNLMKTKWKK